jgi:uncharacterized protein YdaU (DUF1376 family)
MSQHKRFDFWFPWYPAAFSADTMHLTPEQDGIYRRLIDHYMLTRQPLPDNDMALARIAGINLDSYSHHLAIAKAFFIPTGDNLLCHKRCDIELDRQDGKTVSHQKRGKKGAEKRWKNNQTIQDADSNSHASAIAPPMANDSRVEERTGEKKKKEVGSSYVFSGDIIRLDQGDFDKLSKTFHTIPDMTAELTAIDAKFSDDPPAQWFQQLTGWLKKKHEKNLAEEKIPKPRYAPMPSAAGG